MAESTPSFEEARKRIASRIGTVLEQSLEESSLIDGVRQAIRSALRPKPLSPDPVSLVANLTGTLTMVEALLERQKGQTCLHLDLLREGLADALETLRTLERTTADISVLSFEIRLLERFIITSDVIHDWKEHIRAMIDDINSVVEVYFLFSLCHTGEQGYEIEIFWTGVPHPDSRRLLEALVTEKLQSLDGYDATLEPRIVHNISNPGKNLPPLSQDSLSLSTKSLYLDRPQVGGIVGVGINYATAEHPVKVLVIESIITSILNVVGSVKAIYRYTKDLEYYAVRDPLTGLFNQRVFWELLAYEIGRSQRHGNQPFSVMIIDVDDFKKINDTFGHTFGDEFLQKIAGVIQATARKEDIVARYGGDEFAVILPEAASEHAVAMAKRIRAGFQRFSLESPEGVRAKSSVSIGIASWPEHALEPKDLFLVADNMMYRAKAHGKNGHCLPTDADVVEVLRSVSEKYLILQQAIEDRSILPYFQPIVSAAEGTVEAYEVLMRVEYRGKILPAGEFIEIAEESGLISSLDFIVMEKAFRHAVEQNFEGLLFINLSPKAIVTAEFIPTIRRIIQETGIRSRQIVFEITERETVRNASLLEVFISELKSDGSRFAIDDFGSGFSSMTYLKRFSVDFLKVEGDFIRNLPQTGSIDRAIVASIATLTREIGIQTVAESVESPEILEEVRRHGLTLAQGFGIGRPLPEIPRAL